MQGKCWVEGRQSAHTVQSIPSLVLTSLPLGLEQKLQVGPASSSLSKARCKSRCHATAMRASESELVSYHKNIQEWTNIWNLSTPRSCNPGSNRKNEERGCFVCMYRSLWACELRTRTLVIIHFGRNVQSCAPLSVQAGLCPQGCYCENMFCSIHTSGHFHAHMQNVTTEVCAVTSVYCHISSGRWLICGTS